MCGDARSPSPSPGRPPPERYQHGAGIEPPRIDHLEFRQAWRARSRIDRVLAGGEIELEKWQAGIAYRDSFEVAFGSLLRARLPDGTGRRALPRWSGATLTPGERQLAAVESLARVRGEIGAVAVTLVEMVAVEDLPGREIAARLGVRCHKTARAWAVLSLRALAQVRRG